MRARTPVGTAPRPSPARRRSPAWRPGPAVLGGGAVVLAVIVANLLYLTGVFDANPILQHSYLTLHSQAGLAAGQNNIDPNQGYVSQALGHLAAEDWLHGHIPWWNPFEGLGMPLAGEMQSAALFPLVLLDIFGQGQIIFRMVLEITAGLAMLFLLRRLVRSEWAAVAGAVAFALNGTFAWMFHAPGNPIAFAPLVILGVEQAFRPRDRMRSGWALIAIGLALSIYAGFPEVAFIDGLLALIWAAVRATELPLAELKGFIGRLAAGAASAVLLASPLLNAFGTFAQGANLLNHSGTGLASAHLEASVGLPVLFMPYIDGPVFSWIGFDHTGLNTVNFWGNIGGYVGTSLLFLAFLALAGKGQRRLRFALAAWSVLAVGRIFGISPLVGVVNAIPGVDHTAFYRYSNPSISFALIVLGAFAIDDLSSHLHRPRVFCAGGLALLMVIILGVVASGYHHDIAGAPHNRLWQLAAVAFAAFVVLACVAAGALVRRADRRAALLAAIVMTEMLSLFVLPEFSAPQAATLDMAPVRFLQSHLGPYRFFTLGPIQPNYGSYFDVASVNLNDEPMVGSYYDFVQSDLNTNVDPANFTGTDSKSPSGPDETQEFQDHWASYEAASVKYVIQDRGSPPLTVSGKALSVVFSDPLARIYALPDPSPLQSANGGNCTVTTYSTDGAVVDCAGPGVLIRREQYLAGWSATDNGQSTGVVRYDSVFQSVALRPGRNDVRFSFAPPHTIWFLATFVLGLMALAAAAPRRWLRTPRRSDR